MKFEQETLFCRRVYVVCSCAAAIFRFLFSTCKWVESFQSYVNYDNSVGMSKILEIAWSHLTKCHPLRSKPKERGKNVCAKTFAWVFWSPQDFFFEVEFMG